MQTTKLTSKSILPLTCSRSGSCCFGKAVMLNPWELLQFSIEKKVTQKEFRDAYTDFGGIRLTFNGKEDKKGQQACSQYIENKGCSVHLGRPLACRLYPLGRQIQFDKAQYMYEGNQFPCLTDCAEVLDLPKLTVGQYLKGQGAAPYENAQDAYLQVMQNIADIGFELLLETDLATSIDIKTLKAWKEVGEATPQVVADIIGKEWMDALMLPTITKNFENPIAFAQQHNDLLLQKAQNQFGNLHTLQDLHKASVLMIAIALHLAKGLGANPKELTELWVETAKKNGAKE
ncbi:YkgJ family cysteine cluster protein [uncultured Polaribacter sp.]|uniref:YkgJ family cysteine cluster protein n=1 Tax=uncultured Polaribacter sp. TaxID=174711 RepID=UPI002609C74E|nr:YkgJ family cysteine cluster protein [uncultured Polaribacter sp.]